MGSSKLTICSLNVRGLRNKVKRLALFKFLKTQKYDIICLQETHALEQDLHIWQKQWGSLCFFNPGTARSKGEAILVSKSYDNDVTLVEQFERTIVVSIKDKDSEYFIANIYAPNSATDKINFYATLEEKLHDRLDNLILCGDFNCSLNSDLDIVSGQPHSPVESDAFRTFTNSLSLIDAWRSFHDNERDYTWCRFNPFIARRLDYCFISDSILSISTSCNHHQVPLSDHKAVVLEINNHNFQRGPGYWKFNNRYLKDQDFVTRMNSILDTFSRDAAARATTNSQDTWEMLKLEIRNFCIDYSKTKCCEERNEHIKLRLALRNLDKKLSDDPNNTEIINEILETKHKLEVIELNRARGAQTRARQKWIDEGEHNTAFFCSLEKSKKKRNLIMSLRKDSGEVLTKRSEILKEQVSFYKTLYSQNTESTNIQEDSNTFIRNEIFDTLNDNEANQCEGLISIEESSYALYKMKNQSSPGLDGLTTEFYKMFWQKLNKFLIDSYNKSFEQGSLSFTQKQGIITLIHKGKDLEKDKLCNWRPITVLNTDYKILSKVLSERLSTVIQKLIHSDQVGYLKGRNISTVIRSIDDVINYLTISNKSGFLLACDFQKAYDSISKEYLLHVFKVFGFKDNFIKWVSVLMKNTVSSINYEGWVSEFFPVSCGIRQGCNFSPLAFILAVEVLAIKVRNSDMIGIKNPHNRNTNATYNKIKQLADDTTIFLNNAEDATIAINIIDNFSKFSGLKLNIQKTKALKIGNPEIDRNFPVTVVEKIKLLGIYFERGKSACEIEDNWVSRIDKINTLIKNWSRRDLTLHGKVVVIKTFLLSQITFIMQSIGIPLSVLQKLNTILYKFLWQRTHSNRKAFEKVKRKVMQLDYDLGGLKMIDLVEIQKCYYLQWVGKLANSNDSDTWNKIPYYHFDQIGGIFDTNCKSKDVRGIEYIKSIFWKNVLTTFIDNNDLKEMVDINENNFCSVKLFNNHILKYRNKVLFFNAWIRSNITLVKDIINFDENRFLTLNEVQNKVNQNPAITTFEYLAVINTIPNIWKQWATQQIVNQDIDFIADVGIKFNKKPKFIYLQINKNFDSVEPLAKRFWNRKINIDLDENRFILPYIVTKEIRLRELQFKITHNIYATNIMLQKMNVTLSNRCSFCRDQVDYLEHFFFYCDKVSHLWKEVESKISALTGKRLTLTVQSVMFGVLIREVHKEYFKLVNHLLLVAKMSISIAKKTNQVQSLSIIFENALKIRNLSH